MTREDKTLRSTLANGGKNLLWRHPNREATHGARCMSVVAHIDICCPLCLLPHENLKVRCT